MRLIWNASAVFAIDGKVLCIYTLNDIEPSLGTNPHTSEEKYYAFLEHKRKLNVKCEDRIYSAQIFHPLKIMSAVKVERNAA